jgi:hypothetical protein
MIVFPNIGKVVAWEWWDNGRIPWDDTNIEKHNGGCYKRDFLIFFDGKKDVGGIKEHAKTDFFSST